ncbi:Acyl-coenzyme A oxidase 2 [Tephrocybe rancida]|nr:Acyl-coenzyme A oxidase 2 [Tephrocybe rancida]
MRFSTFVYLALVSSAYAGVGPNTNLYILNKDIFPDGFTRPGVLAGSSTRNAGFPGPLITGNKGDTFNLNVIDQLNVTTMARATSIHWHGFFQKNTQFMDGPSGVTQCPILPGNSFLYKFSAAGQAGTFWYHSHLSTQYCDGLRGAFVVYDPNDPHKSRYHVPAPSAGLVPTPDATLINGRGRYIAGPTVPLTVISVIPNKRYRFRIVAISCDPNYIFSIDNHSLTIIEVDGVNVQPLVVDSLQIFAGQRYSVVLNANQAVNNYWIRALSSAGPTVFDGGLNSAILRYFGAANVDPVTTSVLTNPMLEINLHPLSNPTAPGSSAPADVALNLAIAFDFTTARFSVNGASFTPPNNLAVMLQIMSGATSASSLLPAGSIYELPPNKVIELSIPGGAVGAPHPFHLHGHIFSVVRSAGSAVYNYNNPVQRDVVSTGIAGDNVTIRFKTDNAGPWILHCHIDWHLEIGLAVVFAENIPSIATVDAPVAWDNLCPLYEAADPLLLQIDPVV